MFELLWEYGLQRKQPVKWCMASGGSIILVTAALMNNISTSYICGRQTLMSTCWNAVGKLVSKEIFVLLTQCGHLPWGMSPHHNLFMLLQLLLISLMDIIWNWTRNVAVVKQTPLTKHSVPCPNMQCMSNLFIGQTDPTLNYTESVD